MTTAHYHTHTHTDCNPLSDHWKTRKREFECCVCGQRLCSLNVLVRLALAPLPKGRAMSGQNEGRDPHGLTGTSSLISCRHTGSSPDYIKNEFLVQALQNPPPPHPQVMEAWRQPCFFEIFKESRGLSAVTTEPFTSQSPAAIRHYEDS